MELCLEWVVLVDLVSAEEKLRLRGSWCNLPSLRAWTGEDKALITSCFLDSPSLGLYSFCSRLDFRDKICESSSLVSILVALVPLNRLISIVFGIILTGSKELKLSRLTSGLGPRRCVLILEDDLRLKKRKVLFFGNNLGWDFMNGEVGELIRRPLLLSLSRRTRELS